MAPRLLQRFGFLLAAFCVGCSGANSLSSAPQQQSPLAQAAAPVVPMTSTHITGTATSCSGLSACVYAITTSKGTGSATTSALVKYQLPGQAKSTLSQSWTPSVLGHTGTTYHVNGPFTALDANTQMIVTGTTDDYIIQTQHCFRTCSYSYKLSSGRITFTLTNLDGTSTAVSCNPSTFNAGGSTRCTATMTDLANAGSHPTGSISWAITTGVGTFTPPTCTLSSGSCSVTFQPSDETVGGRYITASYPGDSSHYKSSGSTEIYIIGN